MTRLVDHHLVIFRESEQGRIRHLNSPHSEIRLAQCYPIPLANRYGLELLKQILARLSLLVTALPSICSKRSCIANTGCTLPMRCKIQKKKGHSARSPGISTAPYLITAGNKESQIIQMVFGSISHSGEKAARKLPGYKLLLSELSPPLPLRQTNKRQHPFHGSVQIRHQKTTSRVVIPPCRHQFRIHTKPDTAPHQRICLQHAAIITHHGVSHYPTFSHA